MSQPTPNRQRVRRIPVNWDDQEAAIENTREGIPVSEEPVMSAVAQAEPELEPEPEPAPPQSRPMGAQLPPRRPRGAARAVEEVEAEPYDEEPEEWAPIQGRAKGSKGQAGRSPQAARAGARRVPPPAPRTTSSMLGPIAFGVIGGALIGLLIIGVLIMTRNNNNNNQAGTGPVVTATTEDTSSSLGVSDASAPVAVPTNPALASGNPTATINPAEASATPSGLFDTGAPSAARGRFDLPRGIALDGQGNVYVSDAENERIEKFDSSGKFLTAFGSLGSGDGQFNSMDPQAVGTGPSGLAVDSAGNVYVADTWNHRIQKFDSSGKFLASWGTFISLLDPDSLKDPDLDAKFWGPRGVAVGPDNSVYVTDTGNKRVLIFDQSGKPIRKIDSGMSKEKVDANYAFNQPGELNEPIGIAVDGAGNVYVADTHNNRVQKFDKSGKSVAQWPVPEGAWAPGPYLEPFVAVDAAGNVYVTAPTGKSVIEFGPDGKVLGQKTKQGDVALQTPTGIAVTKDGTIYVVDTSANAVLNFGKMP